MLRIQLEATKLINHLAAKGVDVFFGSYIAGRYTPVIQNKSVFRARHQSPQTIVRVRISDAGPSRIKIAVNDEWNVAAEKTEVEDFSRGADFASRYLAVAPARFGSFQPGRGKWQVYPSGNFSR